VCRAFFAVRRRGRGPLEPLFKVDVIPGRHLARLGKPYQILVAETRRNLEVLAV
jgi:hypothetical protein